MEKMTIYFSKPYRQGDNWHAGTSTSTTNDGYYKYKVEVNLPSEIIDIQEIEGATAELNQPK